MKESEQPRWLEEGGSGYGEVELVLVGSRPAASLRRSASFAIAFGMPANMKWCGGRSAYQ